MSTPTGQKPLAKDDKLIDKFPSLNRRKKKQQEIEDLTLEGKQAIESPLNPLIPDLGPDSYHLEEGEDRSMIEPFAKDSPKVKLLIQLLIDWINSQFVDERILIRQLEEDLYDGQILQKLIEKLSSVKIDHPEVTQSEMGQKQRLKVVLEAIDSLLSASACSSLYDSAHWTVDKIYSKDLVAILRLLVQLSRYYKAAIRLPEGVSINVLRVRKMNGQLTHWRENEAITESAPAYLLEATDEQDAFSVMVDFAPEKLQLVRDLLMTFTNSYLDRINLVVTDVDTQFCDGVYLILLMGLLENYFVPLHCFSVTPTSFQQKLGNVQLAFDLMASSGSIPPITVRPEDVVNGDLKAILRVLYLVFSSYKDHNAPAPSAAANLVE